ncbi:Asp-tRNA(Asn)/Glu-tRNA(Gln) amidotransferase subunit GatC [Tahibacter amnicola]|uniref:Aspartyl/glutamyl-tRNA(Asn/Gln) amidotransferase subunit C n=1 Tax=Tahibacter amnicola TaxID=2976241 RepID=A0ABY6BHE1_9GAMM|nr:Asp-tRNA(Asn)/Glu-tRNA(Gln) amidotransferase subunit GatC [Tahibacter amnicola]UXI68006.1 Asp-tRNA(Asn)/Glu-tRNA(Gln) amidotransferase subunit GatC [Tahibacter amnicola]
MHLDNDTVRHIARLARLAVPDAAVDTLRNDLERVLDLFDELAAANVDGLEPLAHPLGQTANLRDDAVTETDRHAELLALAPDSQAGYYVVPKVIE